MTPTPEAIREALKYFAHYCQEEPGTPDYLSYDTHMKVLENAASRLAELLEAMKKPLRMEIVSKDYDDGFNDCRQRILNILEGE